MKELTKQLEILAEEKLFSGVVTISKENQVIYEQSFGYRDRANELKNTVNTKFGIASGTKFFTALGILILIEQNKLSFESKALKLVDYEFEGYSKEITIYELLNHISGMPDYFDEDEIEGNVFSLPKPWYEFYDPKDYFPFFPNKAMQEKTFKYNNGAYVLLAGIIAAVSGKRYCEFIDEAILKPNGLNDSGFYLLNELPKNTAFGYGSGPESIKTNVYNLPIIGGGDGGIFVTAQDLNKLWFAFLNGDIISKKLGNQYFKASVKVDDKRAYYSGMWFNVEKDICYLEGCDEGISFVSFLNKEKDTVFNIISNTTSGAWAIEKLLLDAQ